MMLLSRPLLMLLSYSYVVSASVMESTETYFCQEASQILKSDHARNSTDCEQSWTVKSVTIGHFMNGTAKCHDPCISMTAGEITIGGCVNATLTIICFQGHVTEHRIHFLGVQNNPLPLQNVMKNDHYGIYACLILLLLVCAGFSIHLKSQHCRSRNTGPN